MPEPAQIPADNNTTSDRTNTPAYRLSRVQRDALADIRDRALYIGRDPVRPDHGSGYSRSTLRKLTLAGLICGGPYEAGRGRRLMLTPTGRAAAGPGPAVPTRAEQHETVHACPPPSSGLTPCCGKTPFELPASDRMTSVSGDVTCSTLADAEATDAPIPDAPRRQRIEAALEDCRTLTPTAMAAALLPLLEAEVAEAEERAKKAEDTLARVRWQVEEWQSWAGTEHAIRDMQLALGDIPAPQPQDPAALDHEQPTTGTGPTTTVLDEAVREEQPTARATQNPLVRTDRVLTEISEVLAERARHDDHRDKQTHVDGTGLPVFQHAARRYRDQADRATISGHLAWRDLLLAATYATLADAHPVRLRARLLHLATTTVAWIKDRDHPGHTYSITCALCVGDITVLADALLPLVAAERADAAANPHTERGAGVSWAADRIRARAQAFRDAAHAVHPDAFGYGGPDHYEAWTDAEQRLQAIAKKEEASADSYTSAAQIHTPLIRTEARADQADPGLDDSPMPAIRDAIADFDFAGYGAEIDTDPAAAWIGDLAASIAGAISGGAR